MSVNLRDKQKQETRNALIFGAMSLFLEKGYEEVKLDEVAELVGIHVQTLFKHFKNKAALATAFFDQHVDSVIYALDQLSERQDCYRVWKKSVLIFLETLVSSTDSLKMFQMIHENPVLLAHTQMRLRDIEDKLASLLQQQVSRQDKDPREARILAAIMVGVYRDAHFTWIRSNGEVSSVKLFREFTEILEAKYM